MRNQVVSHEEWPKARVELLGLLQERNMKKAHTGEHASGAIRHEGAAALGAADWLCLAAAPTFAIMALLAAVPGGRPDMLCSTAQHGSALSGMVPMYLLMSAFHSAPWLKLISGRRKLFGQS
jgi:hypothetical protein